jgi:LuxR family transcriptional regulator, maltose regulon positive regulatory protein
MPYFLRTKTVIPPTRPSLIDRPRLLELMEEGAKRALTLIVAPAGFGKTTLAAAWALDRQIPAAWLSLRPSERLRDRFLTYLITALQTIIPQVGETSLAMLRGSAADGCLAALVNDLADVSHDFALILDDYHNADSQEITDVLDFLLENRPGSFHLVIASRMSPSLKLARLRALDQVMEIGANDLRFTRGEEEAFLNTCMGMTLRTDQLTTLHQVTEGWPAGLQLAALALARQPENLISIDGREYIYDYLADEVLQHESAEIQDFLRKSSVLERFCAPLCAKVMSSEYQPNQTEEHIENLITYLLHANLFLIPIDHEGTWYRYHGLFADFLQRQLTCEESGRICMSASNWFEDNGYLEEAIQYALRAGDHDRAASLLSENYIQLLQFGEPALVSELISTLPSEILDKHPRLWLAKGWINILGVDISEAMICIDKAEKLLKDDLTDHRLQGELQSLRILCAIFSGQEIESVDITSINHILSGEDEFLLSLFQFKMGIIYVMQGETSQALKSFKESLRHSKALNNPLFSLMAYAGLGESYTMHGQLKLAETTFEQAIDYAKETLGDQTILLCIPYNSYADLLREWNRFPEALHLAEKSIAYFQQWSPSVSLDSHVVIARILAAEGKWEQSFACLEKIRQIAEKSLSIFDDLFVVMHTVRLKLIQGDLEGASSDIKFYNLEIEQGEIFYHLWEISRLVFYRAKTMQLARDPEANSSLVGDLTALIASAERRERVSATIEALLLQAYAQDQAGMPAETCESLSRAFTLGAACSYLRIFADEGQRLLKLMEKYHGRIEAPSSYLEQVKKIMRIEATASLPKSISVAEGLIPLTQRELDILTLVAEGKSNQEIADERVIALSTVKKHVANILSKLGVANRTQAVLLAKKMGWLN